MGCHYCTYLPDHRSSGRGHLAPGGCEAIVQTKNSVHVEAGCNVAEDSIRRRSEGLVTVQKLRRHQEMLSARAYHRVRAGQQPTNESSGDSPSCVRSLETIVWNLMFDGNLNLFCLRMGALPTWLKRTTTLSSSRIGCERFA